MLVQNGVPWSVAMEMGATQRLAWCVMFGEQSGGRFDWDTMMWSRPDAG
ncbi:hypothetical protein GOB93_14755 [Acetobacter musti]|uniref:Uncharacterized protein n=1 Tax=Acetobacter musti TaxID=864732 RepID=A0ABX0JV66_9PROT|nr:hypothetical protein [Acetobacter musti]NHN85893.1 hypothetical protein [Acetobacter musti]